MTPYQKHKDETEKIIKRDKKGTQTLNDTKCGFPCIPLAIHTKKLFHEQRHFT